MYDLDAREVALRKCCRMVGHATCRQVDSPGLWFTGSGMEKHKKPHCTRSSYLLWTGVAVLLATMLLLPRVMKGLLVMMGDGKQTTNEQINPTPW